MSNKKQKIQRKNNISEFQRYQDMNMLGRSPQIEYSSPSIIMPPPGYHPMQQCNAAPISLDSILEDRQNDVINKIIPDGIHYYYAYAIDSNDDMINIISEYINNNSEDFIAFADDKIKQIGESKKDKLFEYNEKGFNK